MKGLVKGTTSKLFCSIIVILYFGCASTSTRIAWDKPGGSQQEYNQDAYQCMQASKVSWSGGGSGTAGLVMIMGARRNAQNQADELFAMCMRSRGWTDRVIKAP